MRLGRRSNPASCHRHWGEDARRAPHDRMISTNRSNSSVARARSGGDVKFSARHCSAIVLSSTNASRGCLRSTCVSRPVSDWATLSISIPGCAYERTRKTGDLRGPASGSGSKPWRGRPTRHFHRVRMDSRSNSVTPTHSSTPSSSASAAEIITTIGVVRQNRARELQDQQRTDRQNDERADLLGAARVVDARRHAHGQLQRGQSRERRQEKHHRERMCGSAASQPRRGLPSTAIPST